ncbi:MAG: pilus assembly FimT family protein [Candidatus Methylomirabilia bacterium]
MNGPRRQAGFSLVELTIVVAIIGILAAIGIPSLIRTLPRVKLANNTRTLANEIASLRMQAIAKSTEFRMVFDAANNRYTLEKANGAAWTNYGGATTYGSDITSVSGFTPTANILIIRSTGAASVPLSAQATIVLETPFSPPETTGAMAKRILVQATGRVIVQKRNIDGSWVNE